MKRWELAKKQGLNWQVLLIQDCETDIKVITLESIRCGEDYGTTNKKVTSLIRECVKELESPTLKEMCIQTLFKYASRIYLQWLAIYGNKAMGISMLALINAKGINPTEKFVQKIKTLPDIPISKIADYVYNRATPNANNPLEYEKEVLRRVNKLLDTSAKEDYSERYSLRASAERQIRYEWHENNLKTLRENGVRLIWINTHANCSERCQPYQGKLYSLDGTTGTIDGISYQPLENVTEIYETTKSGKRWRNGILSGFNCRHTTKPYQKGYKPDHIPADVIERQRAVETRQRELERTIRQYESRYLGYSTIKETASNNLEKKLAIKMCKHNKELIKKWQNEYIEFSTKNNVPYYPSRLKV
jgi:hypothetical protein